MGVTEIVFIVIGGIILVLSYVLPMGKKESTAESQPKIDEDQIKELIEKEIKDTRSHINDVVDETITYSMEKTERAMERLTNEKIMAISEYSEQVLETINKNHQEVMFLYDMLNDKHENLVNTVSEASKKAREIKQTVQDVEITVKGVSDSMTEDREAVKVPEQEADRQQEIIRQEENVPFAEETEFIPIAPQKVEIIGGMIKEEDSGDIQTNMMNAEEKSYNNNEKILRLHKLGKSKTAIAKELGLGIGEVKLVIDLFEQA